MEPVDGTRAMAGGWGAVGGEGEGWTGLDGEGVAQGGLGMMPLEGGEQPPPGNLAETSCTRKVPALYPHLLFLSPASLLGLPTPSCSCLRLLKVQRLQKLAEIRV